MLKLAIKWGFPFSDNFTYFISTMVAYMYPLCPMVSLKLILHFVVSIALVAITVVINFIVLLIVITTIIIIVVIIMSIIISLL
jgi:hypothetical protein